MHRPRTTLTPQIVLATSGVANTGIDNSGVCGLFRFDCSSLLEYAIQEAGRVGRIIVTSELTDKYTGCRSLKSVLSLIYWKLILDERTKLNISNH